MKPVVLAGGTGSRLWPKSRAALPKQFLSLTSNSTMLQDTITRLKGTNAEPPVFICNDAHRFLVAEQLRKKNIEHDGILLEPVGRNTAPAIALAALHATKNENDPVLLVLAADHVIQDEAVFTKAVSDAIPLAESGKLVTFGIVPKESHTGYGYIKKGESQGIGFTVDAFVEKPSIDVAKEYSKNDFSLPLFIKPINGSASMNTQIVKNEDEMRKGNLWGLPGNIVLFSFIALMVTAGTVVVFGETLTNPTDIVERVGHLGLTIIAAFAFFAATIGINMVANFVPPAYDLANLIPSKIDFRIGGLITAILGFVIGAFWVSVISQIGMFPFVNTLGAILAPVYGIMITDYYIIKKGRIDINDLFSSKSSGKYYYDGGWNLKAFYGWIIAGIFSVATVWHPALSWMGGYAWIIGAALGAILHYLMSKKG